MTAVGGIKLDTMVFLEILPTGPPPVEKLETLQVSISPLFPCKLREVARLAPIEAHPLLLPGCIIKSRRGKQPCSRS